MFVFQTSLNVYRTYDKDVFVLFQICLNVNGKGDALTAFDELYDMPEQSILREDCQALVGK